MFGTDGVRGVANKDLSCELALKLGRGSYIENVADYKDEFWEGIMKILSDIFNKELPFRPTADKERCAACPYAGLCK